MATSDKLAYLNETKQAIKAALIEKGQTVADTDTFRSYADKVKAIVSGGVDVQLLTDVPIELDLAAGNQTVAVPDGYAVKSAIIQKPATLLPENIAEGVTIAGIVGTHQGGGTGGGGGDLVVEPTLRYAADDGAFFMYNGTIYMICKGPQKGSSSNYVYYQYVDKVDAGKFKKVCNFVDSSSYALGFPNDYHLCELDGVVHLFGGGGASQKHLTFNGTSLTTLSDVNIQFSDFGDTSVYNGEIYSFISNKLYKFNGTSFTVVKSTTFSTQPTYALFVNDCLYGINSDKTYIYSLSSGTVTEYTTSISVNYLISDGNTAYCMDTSFKLWKFENGGWVDAGKQGLEGFVPVLVADGKMYLAAERAFRSITL